MSNYEDAIGRAQAMIDAGHSAALRADVDKASILASLARVQLELASMWEPQSEVEVEGTDVSAELLVAALADGSFRSAVLHELKRPYAPLEAQAEAIVELVRGVLMGETPAVAERAASEGDWKSKVTEGGNAFRPPLNYCGVLNDEGDDCTFPKGHPSTHSWTWGER